MADLNLINKDWDSFHQDNCSIYLAGYILIDGKTVNTAGNLFTFLEAKFDISNLSTVNFGLLLSEASGNFSFIVKTSDALFASVDICRTYPIFYSGATIEGFDLFDGLSIEKIRSSKLDEHSILEFYELGFITGKNTICKDIYQLQAGESLFVDSDSCRTESYFEYIPSKNPPPFTNTKEWTSRFDSLLKDVFEKFLDAFPKDTQWVVPLSGGHDSRLMINYLHKTGVKNVVCFTYGNPGNKQSEISKKIAGTVGFDWHFVEYTEEKWQILHQQGIIDEYVNYAFNGVSNPHFQDFLAVYELKQINALTDKAVFLPGHSAITEKGFPPYDTNLNKNDVINNHISKFDAGQYSKINGAIKKFYHSFNEDPNYLYAYFNWREKQSKYTINSIRVYEYFGFKSALPFWTTDVAKSWLQLPYDDLIDRNILYSAEKYGLLEPILYEIPFMGSEMKKKKNQINFKQKLRNILPHKFINILLKKSNWKSSHAEALNLIFAQKGKDIGEILEPIDKFPKEIKSDISKISDRRPHQISIFKISKLYTLKKLLE